MLFLILRKFIEKIGNIRPTPFLFAAAKSAANGKHKNRYAGVQYRTSSSPQFSLAAEFTEDTEINLRLLAQAAHEWLIDGLTRDDGRWTISEAAADFTDFTDLNITQNSKLKTQNYLRHRRRTNPPSPSNTIVPGSGTIVSTGIGNRFAPRSYLSDVSVDSLKPI